MIMGSRRKASSPLSVAALALACTLVLSGCGIFGGEDDVVARFSSAFNDGDIAAAAALTTDPAAASATLQAVFDGVGGSHAQMVSPAADMAAGQAAATRFEWTVPAGDVVLTEGGIEVTDEGDRIHWSPQIIDGRLQEGGRLVFADELRFTTPIVDRHGVDLMSWAPITLVTVDPGNVAAAGPVASVVSSVEPTIDGGQIRAAIAAAPTVPYTVIALREEDLAPIRAQLSRIAGVTLVEQGRLVTADRGIDAPMFPELRDYWQDTIEADAGWSLSIANPGGSDRIGGEVPSPLDPIRTTLDIGAQSAAQRAVDTREEPAVIVAMRASTGEVLAVAQNEEADEQGPIALTGLFPPGSTFKTVTTAAALQAGIADADSVLPCPGRTTVAGRSIPNDDEFDLGEVPLHTAFAQSCNTTQAALSVQLGPADMRDAAASLGFGVDFTIPGMTTVTGTAPVTDGGAERVEAAIGQGTVVASPFGITEMVASLANGGRMVLPILLDGQRASADQQPAPLDLATVDALRAMMRETVESGTARGLSDISGLGGKTGTAEIADGRAHGWFAGIDGDIAFTAFIEGADSSGPAVTMAGDFLRGAGDALYG